MGFDGASLLGALYFLAVVFWCRGVDCLLFYGFSAC